MWHVLEVVCGIVLESLVSWRFYVCLLIALALVGLIYWLLPESDLSLLLSASVVIAGITTGIIWEWRNR